jgi:ubiquinone/menaquinone biosynthesis C-methylase UbiE
MNSSDGSLQQIKARMRATWMAGDFGVVAKTVAASAQEFIARLNIPAGARALDIATGTGNVALPLARSGALVTGVDIAPNLLAQARERAAAENLAVQFDEGDAEQLPYADGSFDAVVTMFGAMFAPRPEVVASEMARVLRPGGLLGMANWTPESFTARMFAVGNRHVPPPPGIVRPVLWGDVATVRERLAPWFTDIETQLIPVPFDMAMNAAEAVKFFRKYLGPIHVAFERLDAPGQAALAADLETLWASANVSPDPENHLLVPNEYLQVTARRD